MTPFLQLVARAYVESAPDEIAGSCFVFPNKRAAIFFERFMREELSVAGIKPAIMPETTTITDFIASFSPELTQANRYDLLLTLFDEYRRISTAAVSSPKADGEEDFDRFIFWGEMLVADFDDVDRYLADADAIFTNIKRYREISSNFLTPDQIDIIRRFWGEERSPKTVDEFWDHIGNEESESSRSFLKLWEVLGPLYHAYHDSLASAGLASQGMLMRNAVKATAPTSHFNFEHARYIFVGFNMLSTAEIKIFSNLQRRGMADFYWDYNSPALDMPLSNTGRYLKRNIKEFPSRFTLDEPQTTTMPDIQIIGISSGVGQAKAAGSILKGWVDKKIITNPDNAISTAVVLPDESLFIPMIHSVPESIGTLNVTMGLPMRLGPMASLIKSIISLQLRSRRRSDGSRTFFHEDVSRLLSSGLLAELCPEGSVANLESEIRRRRLFNVDASMIIDLIPELSPVFHLPMTPDGKDFDFPRYLTDLCDFLLEKTAPERKMQRHFVESYSAASAQLFDAASRLDINMSGEAFCRLVERAVASDKVPFNGEPLEGLQLMGVLETRLLDFDNVIILSMNERIFPRRRYSRSFIPDALRHGYGLSTLESQESTYAYYFYRLLSRARRVTLLYDARNSGLKSGEPSRYISQLLYFYPETVSHLLGSYRGAGFTQPPINVEKTPEVLGKMRRFLKGGGSNLSASAINTYINCPLSFYLQYVERYNPENEITDFIDSSTYGSIIHAVAQRVFLSFRPSGSEEPVTVTGAMLERVIEHTNPLLDRIITEETNLTYNRMPPHRLLEPLTGECKVMGKVIRASIVSILRRDIARAPFTFVEAELSVPSNGVSLTFNATEGLDVNMRMIIDRVDRMPDGSLCFIDYKSGGDALTAPDLESLFETDRPNRAKAILQLLLYCHLYNRHFATDVAIRPLLYKILDMSKSSTGEVRIAKKAVTDYHSVIEPFLELLRSKIAEIFNPEVPFRQAADDHNCTFCQMKAMCGRKPAKI